MTDDGVQMTVGERGGEIEPGKRRSGETGRETETANRRGGESEREIETGRRRLLDEPFIRTDRVIHIATSPGGLKSSIA